VTAKVDQATLSNPKDNILLAADHYKYLIEAFQITDWQETDYLENPDSFGNIFISTTRKEGQLLLTVTLEIGTYQNTLQYTAIKSPEIWFKDVIAGTIENILARSFNPVPDQPKTKREYPVNNYFGGALVRLYKENRFNGDNVYAVMQIITEINHSLFKNWRGNVAFADERYQALVQAFSEWHKIDYYTNKPVHGSLKATYDPRWGGIVTWMEFSIKDYTNRKKHRRAQLLEEWLKEDVVEEVDTRLKEQYQLKL